MGISASRGLFAFLFGFTLALGVGRCTSEAATTILPPGATCFQQATGPVSSGSVYMLVPGTTTPKTTFQNSAQTILNSNPIQLDANGCAIIYGTGSYRQQVYTGPVVSGLPSGNLLYDVTTADTSSFNAVFWAGTSGGTPNAITVADAGFNNTDGSVINFLALNTNTGAATLNVSGGGAIPIRVPGSAGPVALTSGCIVAGNPVSVVYSSSGGQFLLLTACQAGSGGGGAAVAAVGAPGGYLTLSSDTNNPVLTADSSGASIVYYTPYVSNQVPIWNGTSFTIFAINQLTLTLTAPANLANTIYDVCIFSNSGVLTLVTGPAWANSGGGTGSRGTGAGTTQISRQNGIWVNTVQITASNNGVSYTVPAQQCTYVGSILIDFVAGTVSNYLSYGQNRKWSVWNAYNRLPIVLQAGDPTASWLNNAGVTGPSNATSGNAATALTGLAEEAVAAQFNQTVSPLTAGSNTRAQISIGLNTTGTIGQSAVGAISVAGAGTITETLAANYLATPTIGINKFIELENGSGNVTSFFGTINNMLMTLKWHG